MIDFKQMTFAQMADVVASIWLEVKRRNPIGVNLYAPPIYYVVSILREIGKAERTNPTCEAGLGIDAKKKKYKLHWSKLSEEE